MVVDGLKNNKFRPELTGLGGLGSYRPQVRAGGGIGRHIRLRGVRREACWFKSSPAHHSSSSTGSRIQLTVSRIQDRISAPNLDALRPATGSHHASLDRFKKF